MTDPCWMAAQLLMDCSTKSSQEPSNLEPLPEATEVEMQSLPAPQPQRIVTLPQWNRSLSTPLSPEQANSAGELRPPVSSPLRRSLRTVDGAPSAYPDSLPLWSRTQTNQPASQAPQAESSTLTLRADMEPPSPLGPSAVYPQMSVSPPSATPVALAAPAQLPPRPQTGGQLFQQRWAALRAGQLYTRTTASSFIRQWQQTSMQPSYEQWQALLAQEAQAVESGQGRNRLSVIVGDSLSLWLPPDSLPQDRFWLNQGISGDTTSGILQRLHLFAGTRPDTIHLMAGINDLKNGASDVQVVRNLKTIMQRLQQQHPQAQIVVHSILPTRWAQLPSHRIQRINQYIAYLAEQQGVEFLNLQSAFADAQGNLRSDLTSDGLHLNPRGYQLWQLAMQSI